MAGLLDLYFGGGIDPFANLPPEQQKAMRMASGFNMLADFGAGLAQSGAQSKSIGLGLANASQHAQRQMGNRNQDRFRGLLMNMQLGDMQKKRQIEAARLQSLGGLLNGDQPPAPMMPPPSSAPQPGPMPGGDDNNPLNLRDNGDPWQGRKPPAGPFVSFNTPEDGVRANIINMRTQAQRFQQEKGRPPTYAEMISIWAPRGDGGNDPVAYAAAVKQYAGIDPNTTPVNLDDPMTLTRVIGAMNRVEKGKQTITPDTIARGYDMAMKPPQQVAQNPGVANDAGPQRADPMVTRHEKNAQILLQRAQALYKAGDGEGAEQAYKAHQDALTKAEEARQRAQDRVAQNANRDIIIGPDGRPSVNDALLDVKLKIAERGKTAVNIDQRAETKGQEELAKLRAKSYEEIQKGGRESVKAQATYDQLGALLEGIETGKFTGAGKDIVKSLRGLGFKPEEWGITDNTGKLEAAEAIANKLALALRNPNAGEGMPGAMSDKDREFLVSMIPGLDTTPQGRKLMLSYYKRINEYNRGLAAHVRAAVKKGGLDVVDDAAEEYAAKNPIFNQADIDAVAQLRGGGQRQPQQTQSAAPPPQSGGPAPGSVVDGYRFKGGNYRDQNNWERVVPDNTMGGP